MSKRKSILSRVITAVLVLLVLALGFGAIYKFTRVGDDITDLFDTTYRVEYAGVNYTGNKNEIELTNEQARFDVKSVNGYRVEVKPNVTAETDFVYTVDGIDCKFSETNLNSVFLTQDNVKTGYFTLNELDSYSLESVLSKVHKGRNIVLYNTVVNPYLLVITSGEQTVEFVLKFPAEPDKPIAPRDLTIDTHSICF